MYSFTFAGEYETAKPQQELRDCETYNDGEQDRDVCKGVHRVRNSQISQVCREKLMRGVFDQSFGLNAAVNCGTGPKRSELGVAGKHSAALYRGRELLALAGASKFGQH